MLSQCTCTLRTLAQYRIPVPHPSTALDAVPHSMHSTLAQYRIPVPRIMQHALAQYASSVLGAR
eukprot:1397176-Rhodomonas_salina.1